MTSSSTPKFLRENVGNHPIVYMLQMNATLTTLTTHFLYLGSFVVGIPFTNGDMNWYIHFFAEFSNSWLKIAIHNLHIIVCHL